MNEDPPPAPEETPPPAAPADPENLFAVALAKNNNDSFPVLNAFQTFLDQERERARRRVVTMAVCFTGAMIVLLLVFGILFAMFFSRMMVRNEQQQDKLLDLVARGIPAAVHEAGYASGAGGETVTRTEVLEALQQLSAERAAARAGQTGAGQSLPAGLASVPVAAPRGAPAPSTVVPSAVVPYGSEVAAGVAVPSSPARDDLVASPPPRTGVLSVADRQVQQAKEAQEEARRRARLAAVQAAEAQAAAEAAAAEAQAQAAAAAKSWPAAPPVPARDDLAAAPVSTARDDLAEGDAAAPAAAPAVVPSAPSPSAGPLPFALPAGVAPAAAVETVPLDAARLAAAAAPTAEAAPTAAAPTAGRRAIAVKTKRRMGVPEGFSTDRAEVETASGERIPFRLLVPVPDASR